MTAATTQPAWQLLDVGDEDRYVPTYSELTWRTTSGVRYVPHLTPPPFQNGAVRYRLELRDLDGLLMYSAPATIIDLNQPAWDFSSASLSVFGTVMISRVPATYDATADGADFATRGGYMVIGTGTPIDSEMGEDEDTLVLYGPLTIRFMQPAARGRMQFYGGHGCGCGCGCGCGGGGWQPEPEPEPGPGPEPQDAVLVYGDQYIEGQKDFDQMPTVRGVPVDAAASQWFTGDGPPGEPFPGADINDYYLDTGNGPGRGNVYRLADQLPTAQSQSQVMNMTPGTHAGSDTGSDQEV